MACLPLAVHKSPQYITGEAVYLWGGSVSHLKM
jgi:hypothetical protein